MELSRRGLLALGLTGPLVSGCSGAGPTTTTAPRSSSPSGSSSGSSTPSAGPSTPALPVVRRWRPSAGDLEPACKQAAVTEVLRRTTSADQVTEVVDAQYGGLLAASASVLVATRTWRRSRGRVLAGGRTFDVRLSAIGSRWVVERVLPSRPGPPAPALPRVARRVLGSDRVDLPPAAAADVASGRVSSATLAGILALAQQHPIGISVVRSGHPLDVFGTTRPSDHPRGRAFDVWRIAGRAVVDPATPRRLVTDLMRAAADTGAYNVGGPYLLGAAPQFFSDRTHHDHVHVGFAS